MRQRICTTVLLAARFTAPVLTYADVVQRLEGSSEQ